MGKPTRIAVQVHESEKIIDDTNNIYHICYCQSKVREKPIIICRRNSCNCLVFKQMLSQINQK